MLSLKEKVAHAALEYVEDHRIIGIGTGSTVNCFIDALVKLRSRIEGCVASSHATEERLRALGFPVLDLNVVDEVPIYIDGADEVNAKKEMIKGGGGALLREKILASVAKTFVCIVDESKHVTRLGAYPVAIEVLPMARSFVAREVVKLGADPVYRQGVLTDNGGILLDVYHLNLEDPLWTETTLNRLPGVLENGVFAQRRADHVLIAGEKGVKPLA